ECARGSRHPDHPHRSDDRRGNGLSRGQGSGSPTAENLLHLAHDVVHRALAGGATGAECTIAEGEEVSADIRMREIENIQEAGSRAMGLRILRGLHTGSSYTSDLSLEGIERLVKSAIELADITSEDPHAGLPDPADLGVVDSDLKLYSESLATL